MDSDGIHQILNESRTATFTTLGSDGYPHSTAVWYAPSSNVVMMTFFKKSQKVVNLQRNPACSFHVEAGERYADLRGVLIRGDAELIDDPNNVMHVISSIYARYYEKFEGPMSIESRSLYEKQSLKRAVIELPLTNVIGWDHRSISNSGPNQ